MYKQRPWGGYTSVINESNHQVKTITVKPGQRLSKQYHHSRQEHWVIVSGRGTVELDNEIISVMPGKYIHVPVLAVHRIENTSDHDLVFIEVQLGDYLGEDDIVRLDDDYGRLI
tara:strand:- start:224 stop:565 length:342 start_codon:yes stop_codon:yes gene_type:complete